MFINNIEHMNLTDSAHSEFSGVRFTYRTGSNSKSYLIQVRSLSVHPLD